MSVVSSGTIQFDPSSNKIIYCPSDEKVLTIKGGDMILRLRTRMEYLNNEIYLKILISSYKNSITKTIPNNADEKINWNSYSESSLGIQVDYSRRCLTALFGRAYNEPDCTYILEMGAEDDSYDVFYIPYNGYDKSHKLRGSYDDKVIFTDSKTNFLCYDYIVPQKEWEVDLLNTSSFDLSNSSPNTSTISKDGVFYISYDQRFIIALDISDGSIIWEYDLKSDKPTANGETYSWTISSGFNPTEEGDLFWLRSCVMRWTVDTDDGSDDYRKYVTEIIKTTPTSKTSEWYSSKTVVKYYGNSEWEYLSGDENLIGFETNKDWVGQDDYVPLRVAESKNIGGYLLLFEKHVKIFYEESNEVKLTFIRTDWSIISKTDQYVSDELSRKGVFRNWFFYTYNFSDKLVSFDIQNGNIIYERDYLEGSYRGFPLSDNLGVNFRNTGKPAPTKPTMLEAINCFVDYSYYGYFRCSYEPTATSYQFDYWRDKHGHYYSPWIPIEYLRFRGNVRTDYKVYARTRNADGVVSDWSDGIYPEQQDYDPDWAEEGVTVEDLRSE